MLAYRADAVSTAVTPNEDEVEDAAWFSRTEVQAALTRSKRADSWSRAPTTQEPGSADAAVKLRLVPPPFAIAHWLMQTWAEPANL